MIEFIENIEGLIVSRVALLKDFYTLIKLEARLAGMNIIPLVVYSAVLIALITGFGLTLICSTAYLLYLITGNILIVMPLMLLIMAVLMYLVARLALGCMRQMSFAKTRQCFNKPPTGEHYVEKERAPDSNRLNRGKHSKKIS